MKKTPISRIAVICFTALIAAAFSGCRNKSSDTADVSVTESEASVSEAAETNNEEPPAKPDGESPEEDGNQPPEKPDGEPPQGNGGQPPAMPGGFGGNGEVTNGTSAYTIDSDSEISDEKYFSDGGDENAL